MSREALQLSVSGLADEFSCALGTDLFQASAFRVFVSAFFVSVSFFFVWTCNLIFGINPEEILLSKQNPTALKKSSYGSCSTLPWVAPRQRPSQAPGSGSGDGLVHNIHAGKTPHSIWRRTTQASHMLLYIQNRCSTENVQYETFSKKYFPQCGDKHEPITKACWHQKRPSEAAMSFWQI